MSRPATNRLKVNPQLGHRPSLEFRRLNELRIDPTYQRTIQSAASQSLIRRIAQYWDWALCQPLTVARRADGALMVVDGQHRLEAARLRRDIDDLPCVVTAYASTGDEAAAFVALNQQRRPLSNLDLFKAAIAAEDTDALAIMDLIASAGLTLATHTNYTAWKPGMVSNIAGIRHAYRYLGSKATGRALQALASAFPGEVLRYAGTIFPGIAGFVANELRIEGRLDQDRLVAALQSLSQRQWVIRIGEEAAHSGNRRDLAARTVVAARYKGSTTAPKLVPTPAGPVTGTGEKVWCAQCDKRVDRSQAHACPSPFCKAKAEAA